MTATGASTGQPLSDQKLEVGHVLFMDIVGYSILNIEEQKRIVESLQEVVRGTGEFQHASAEGRVRPLPTGDGMALVFFVDPEAPLRCAVEISRALRLIPAIRLRMGIHAGPVYRVGDINTNRNVAGGGVNIAQRVMDCGDAGHILVSEETARFFAQVGNWAKSLHDVGNTRVKHGVKLHLFSLYVSEVGNSHLPHKLKRERFRKTTAIGGILLAAAVISSVLLVRALHRSGQSPQHALYHQLTRNDPKRLLNSAVISPNGSFLAYVDARGLFVLDIKSGESTELPAPRDEGFAFAAPDWYLAWSPDSTRVYASGPSSKDQVQSIWVFPLLGSASKRLIENAEQPKIATDGSIAYVDAATERQIWITGPEEGEAPRLLKTAPQESSFAEIAWAPRGKRLAYIQQSPDGDILGSVDSQGGETSEVVKVQMRGSGSQGYYSGLCWARDGRIIFVAGNPLGTQDGSNLWAIPVDISTGEKLGEPQQMTDDLASFQSDLSITADGKSLCFVRYKQRVRILLAPLEAAGPGLTKTEEFVSGESNNWADRWTSDSKYLLITSDRKGDITSVFRQGLNAPNPEPLHPADEIQENAVAISESGSILYWSSPKSEGAYPKTRTLIMLDPNGTAHRFQEKPDAGLACALKTPVCILRSSAPPNGNTFALLDLKNFQTTSLPTPKTDLGQISDWDISSDGKTIAMVRTSPLQGVIRLLSVVDGSVTDVTVRGWSGFDSVAWSANGASLYVTSNVSRKSAVLRVDLTGAATILWDTDSEGLAGAVAPSPDGKYIAFSVTSTRESNAWYIERF